MTQTALENRLINFSVEIINFSESIKPTYAGIHLAKQLTRSGTSVALNYGETRGAESQKDFIHKMGIVVKELRESHVCLKILAEAQLTSNMMVKELTSECNELIAIFVASINTTKKK